MSKRIEKEPDGYIRDLQRKKKFYVRIIVTINLLLMVLPLFIAIVITIQTFSPPPSDDKIITGTYVFKECDTDRIGTRRSGGRINLFIASTGEQFAIPDSLKDENFIIGKSYTIGYTIGFFYSSIYTMSDGENVLLSEVDQDIIREQNIASYPKNIIESVTIFFVFAAVSNIFPLFFVYKEIYFLNKKIKQRRKRRAIKNDRAQNLP